MKRDPTSKVPLRKHINLHYLRLQMAWAGWMERQSQKLGRRGQIAAFAIFLALSSCCCIFLITCGFGWLLQHSEVQLTPVKTLRIDGRDQPDSPPSDTTMARDLQAFHIYMDSLAVSVNGKHLRDSILRARPGLMDSIRMAESLYLTKN